MATKAKPKKTREKKQHTPDYYPVERHVNVGSATAIPAGPNVGDMGKLLSIRNRRLYRYGMKYQIKVSLDTSASTAIPTELQVFALSDNWDVQRAYALAKKTYDDAYADELGKSGVVSARWRDFRVFHGVTGANELDPVTYDASTLAPAVQNLGEHNVSSVDVGGVDTEFSWAAGGGRLDILGEWANAGRTSTQPSIASTNAPYNGVNADDLSDIEFDRAQTDGDFAPYGSVAPHDQWKRVGTIRIDPTTGLTRVSTGYFDAPCGLFVIINTTPGGGTLANGTVTVTAKAGGYKGIAAEKMCQ